MADDLGTSAVWRLVNRLRRATVAEVVGTCCYLPETEKARDRIGSVPSQALRYQVWGFETVTLLRRFTLCGSLAVHFYVSRQSYQWPGRDEVIWLHWGATAGNPAPQCPPSVDNQGIWGLRLGSQSATSRSLWESHAPAIPTTPCSHMAARPLGMALRGSKWTHISRKQNFSGRQVLVKAVWYG
jgi:hypothetical protein